MMTTLEADARTMTKPERAARLRACGWQRIGYGGAQSWRSPDPDEHATSYTLAAAIREQLRREADRGGGRAMTGDPAYTRQAVKAIARAVDHEHDFAGWLADILARVAAIKGSSDVLTAGRPGSWEASLVDQLVKGTVGYDDEYLPDPAGASS